MKQKQLDRAVKSLLNAGKLPKHKRKEPTEVEFKNAIKNILLKKLDKPLKGCIEYPTSKQLREKSKLEFADLSI